MSESPASLPTREAGLPPSRLAIGDRVERYHVDSLVRQDKGTATYRVTHEVLKSPHLLKVTRVHSPTVRRRLLREGQTQARLRHTNLIVVSDVFEIPEGAAIVLEDVGGATLAGAMGEPMDVPTAMGIFEGLVHALRAAHRADLTHLDLRPAVVHMVDVDGVSIPKLSGFHMARRSGRPDKFAATGMGEPAYTAPEQFMDAQAVDHRADLYALGCLLYEMLAGRPAFAGPDPFAIYDRVARGDWQPLERLRPDVPVEIVQLVSRLMSVDAAKRPEDCDEIIDSMNWLRTVTQETLSLPEAKKRTAPAPVSRVPLVAAGVLALALAGLLAGALLL